MCCIKFDPKRSISQSRVAWVGAVRFTFNFQTVSMAHIFPNQSMLFASQKRSLSQFWRIRKAHLSFSWVARWNHARPNDDSLFFQHHCFGPNNYSIPKLFPFVYINCCHAQLISNQPKLQPQSSNLHQLVESWFLRKQIRPLIYCCLVWPHSHGMLHTCALFLLTDGRFTRNLPKQLRARKTQKSARTSRCKRRVFPEPLATGQF